MNIPQRGPVEQTLVVVGHPDPERSRVTRTLLAGLADTPGVSIRMLAEHATEGVFDVAAEQREVEAADHVVLQYPTYWYAPPALLKLWLDSVMTSPWAYGPGAPGALAGKTLRVVTSTGGVADGYQDDGFHGWEYDAVLTPLKATARRLGTVWLEPIVVHGVRELSAQQLTDVAADYRRVLLDTTSARRTAA